jgi:hypothetical protein
MNPNQEIIRHFIASVKYRFNKVVNAAPSGYPTFTLPNGIRSPLEVVNHMTHVLYCAKSFVIAPYNEVSIPRPEKLEWEDEVKRFLEILKETERLVEQSMLKVDDFKILLQGPLADVMTHVGQLALLRRAAGSPITGEDFMKADI